MGVYDNRAIVLDISHYQNKVDWAKCDADYVIIKAGESTGPDVKCAEHVQGAYDAGIPTGLYWFFDPALYALAGFGLNDISRWWSPEQDKQLQALINQCRTKVFHSLAIDIERWWLSYAEYYDYVNGKRPLDQVGKITNAWISTSAKVFCGRVLDWLKRAYPDGEGGTTKRLMIYSANWFIDAHAPDMRAWIDQYEQWPAEYKQPAVSVTIANLAEYKSKYLSTYGPDVKPKWLGNKPWTLWQISGDKFKLPWVLGATGQPSAVDINISALPREQFLAWLGVSSATPPPPDEEPDPEPGPTGDLAAVVAKLDALAADVAAIRSHFNP